MQHLLHRPDFIRRFSSESAAVEHARAAIDRLASLTVAQIARQPRPVLRQPGVYFLIGRGREVLYVGRAANMFKRVRTHTKQRRIPFLSALYLACREEGTESVEAAYIHKLLPAYNCTAPPIKRAAPRVNLVAWRRGDPPSQWNFISSRDGTIKARGL